MKSATAFLTASALTSLSTALSIAPRSPNPRALSLPIERRTVPDVIAHDRQRRRKRQSNNVVEQELDNDLSLYYANLSLGTPAQSLRLHIDTGSSDLWVNTAGSAFCSQSLDPCEGGTYDPNASSSHNVVNSFFNISYVDGSSASGNYVTDTLRFGGVDLQDFQFGVGEVSSSDQGVLGIGYAANEVQVNRAGLDPYPNLPVALVDAGHIASPAYSLWLNDLDASRGEILFGGVNTERYEGDLATLPIIQTYGGYYELVVALTGLTMDGQTLSSNSFPAGVLLDSGATLTYLPNDLVETIYNEMQAVYVPDVGAAYAVCTLRDESKTIDFEFSGKTIKVGYDELLLDAGTTSTGRPLTFDNGDPACLFGIAPADDSIAVLGDTFLRSAYVVYDLANNEISIAQTTFNATQDDIREIGTGSNSVPGAIAVASPVTSVVAESGGARLGGATGTVTGLGSPSSTSSSGAASVLELNLATMAVMVMTTLGVIVAL